MRAYSFGLIIGLVCSSAATPAIAAQDAGKHVSVLHSFGSSLDGMYPKGSLIDVNGILYGTTLSGGAASPGGTAFSLDPTTGAEKVVYSFCSSGSSCSDGDGPWAGVVEANGTLYGTTVAGGADHGGVVFAIDAKTGVERVLHSFCSQQNCADGYFPSGGVIRKKDTLYGTTLLGGLAGGEGAGVVFAIDLKTGVETMVYSFCSQKYCPDGDEPQGGLVDVNGILYGTALYGGTIGNGVVFALNPAKGSLTVQYSFCSKSECTDGGNPESSLIDVNGTLYGTTSDGGSGTGGRGTVFGIVPGTGAETVLHSFCSEQNCTDGAYPEGNLIASHGLLYGMTSGGGLNGDGTVFSVDLATGTESVLYSFCKKKNCADGTDPAASLLDIKGSLFGTTEKGGAYGFGALLKLHR
jgi:uncharacterized repeat protein (TIGR03803 family)